MGSNDVGSVEAFTFARKMRRIANETAELPGLRLLARPLYRYSFARTQYQAHAYYGIYRSYEEALASLPKTLPGTYDVQATERMYRDRFERIRCIDYPMVHWLSKLLADGERGVFDLGGHTGVSYYGFGRYLAYPDDLRWTIHDVPAAVAAGRLIAGECDTRGLLRFTDRADDAQGHGVLLAAGVLQYLQYTLPEFLARLADPPRHVLVNMTPMHPQRGYFTLQNLGIAICPYRIMALPEFLAGMATLGYEVVDRWESREYQVRVPFAPQHMVDRYTGLYLRRRAEGERGHG